MTIKYSITALMLSIAVCLSSFAMATDFGMFATSPLRLNAAKSVQVGQQFTVSVGFKLSPGSSMSAYSVSIQFENDLDNELDVVNVSQPSQIFAPSGGSGGPLATFGTPSIIESTSSSGGEISSFSGSAPIGTGIVNTSSADMDIIVGSITFVALAPLATDGIDADVGFFDGSDMLVFNNGSQNFDVQFGNLSVNVLEVAGVPALPYTMMGILSKGFLPFIIMIGFVWFWAKRKF